MDLEMVSYLSKLGKLSFTEEELKQTAAEMTSIIEIMDTIKEIDIKYDALADNHNVYLNDLREDTAQPLPDLKNPIQRLHRDMHKLSCMHLLNRCLTRL